MDSKPCIHCATPLYGENRCPSCGALQSRKTGYISLTSLGLFICLALFVFRIITDNQQSKSPLDQTTTQAITVTGTTQTSTATATPFPTLTLAPVFPTPTGDEWVKLTVVPLLYAKSNTCLIFDANSLKLCGGETIDLYVTRGYWHIAWVNPDNTITYTEITPGKVVTVTIPVDALDVYFGNLRP